MNKLIELIGKEKLIDILFEGVDLKINAIHSEEIDIDYSEMKCFKSDRDEMFLSVLADEVVDSLDFVSIVVDYQRDSKIFSPSYTFSFEGDGEYCMLDDYYDYNFFKTIEDMFNYIGEKYEDLSEQEEQWIRKALK